MAIAVSLVIVLVPAGTKRRNLAMLAAAFAVIMALSRVYLRADWLSDALGGAALGAAVAIGAALPVHRIEAWRNRPQRLSGRSDTTGMLPRKRRTTERRGE